ncbi:uncharacterized protein tp53i13 [Eucyclogobius newberryi]|uniref:uncharacterized protein tp53i13 n=1 Tax=Eucyclogobius newberryi TaxID=166745 RepID=UPI003B5BD930
MPSRAIATLPGSAAVLAALWVTVGRCLGEAPGPGCDNGKVLLDADLPKDAAHWDCPSPLWSQSQGLYSVETVHDPETAKMTCMDQRITYNHTIPNSGAFRPVSAESGEYLYCPAQRWIHNLHRGATVLLYHPCSPPHQRRLLSALARSCIHDYILTPHKDLDKNRPVALVSWGRTLEVSTAASSEICDWLNATSSATPKAAERRRQIHHYNLLLTRSAERDGRRDMKGSVKQCCERTISSRLEDPKETRLRSSFGTRIVHHNERRKRAALKSTTDFPNVSGNQTGSSGSSVIHQLQSNALPRTISSQNGNQSGAKGALSQSISLKGNPAPKKFVPNTSRTAINSVSLMDLNDDSASKSNSTDVFKDKNQAVAKAVAESKANEVIAVEEREVDNTNKGVKSRQSGSSSAPKSQAIGDERKSGDCRCEADQVCECGRGAGDESRSADESRALPRTPRTDEAVWAAGALGFLLALLTLSILHTRLYRHWRRGTSLYWHDPKQDYDSVADVIRRRMRLTKRRPKRSRKKECVLLPSSSSSEEYP